MGAGTFDVDDAVEVDADAAVGKEGLIDDILGFGFGILGANLSAADHSPAPPAVSFSAAGVEDVPKVYQARMLNQIGRQRSPTTDLAEDSAAGSFSDTA